MYCYVPIHTLTFSERSDSTLHLQNQSTSGKNYRNKKHWRSFFSFKKKGCTNFHRIQKEKCTTTNMKMNICSFLHSRLSSYRLFLKRTCLLRLKRLIKPIDLNRRFDLKGIYFGFQCQVSFIETFLNHLIVNYNSQRQQLRLSSLKLFGTF